jgi:TolB-like protein/Tfp pilus assembly protein PilF
MSPQSQGPVTEKSASIAPSAVRVALEEVIASPDFAKVERPSRFLRHLVEATLRGETHRLKESVLGVEVFGRKSSWDPRLDAIVRQEAARLRKRLARHYEAAGAQAPVRIDLPVGGYVPVFVSCSQSLESPAGQAATGNLTAMAAEVIRSDQPTLTRKRIFAAGVILCALAGAIGWRYWRTVVAERENRFSIAVLPFTNLSADPANQYFADGLTDEITDLLARNRTLRVSARASASQFGTKSGDLGNVGRKLNVANVLEGSVDRSGDRIRIIAHLERVSDGSHLWSNTYERQTADLFAVQSELAQAIAGNLKAAEGLPAAPKHVPSAEAHDFYLKGRYELQQLTPASLNLAEADFQRAIDLDPAYAAAYAGLGTARYDRSPAWTQVRMDADRTAAEEAYRKALELDPDQTGVHAPLASMKMQYDWDWAGAERELKQALAGAPDANANVYYAFFLLFHGRLEEADPYLRRAQDLDPFGSATLNNIALARAFQGRYTAALDVLQKLLMAAPNMVAPQLVMGSVHILQGHPDVALADFEKLEQRFPQAQMYEAMAQAAAGHRAAALQLMRPYEEKYPNAGIPMQWFALAYGFMGDEANTVKWLGRSADGREWQALNLAVNPIFASMRTSPGFRALKKRMGLGE